MEEVPEPDPLERPVSVLAPAMEFGAAFLHAPSPENLLHELLSRTFTSMHCYVKSHAFEAQSPTGRGVLIKNPICLLF